MRDIIFYDFEFNRLSEFNKFISLNFELNYCGYGKAELHFSLSDPEIIKLLHENPYMFFKAGDNFAIVTGWKIGEDIAIFGRTPEWLLTKRGVRPFSMKGTLPEEIANFAVSSGAGDFVNAETVFEIGEKTDYSTNDVKTVYDAVCEVLNGQHLGFKVAPDIENERFVFSVYEGKEALCLISQSNRTAYNMEYTVEKQDMVTNSGWYERKFQDMGGWDAYKNVPPLSDSKPDNAYAFYEITSETYYKSGDTSYPVERFGFTCNKGYYIYSDALDGKWKITPTRPDTIWIHLDNSNEVGAKKWDAVLSGIKTEEEARFEILKKVQKETSEAEVKSIEFGDDYSLGDIVGVQTEFGEFKKAEKKRVTAVNIYYDVDKAGVIPILTKEE